MLDSNEIGLYFEYSNLDPFLNIALTFLVFKVKQNILEEINWLKMIDISSFDNFKTLVEILLGP